VLVMLPRLCVRRSVDQMAFYQMTLGECADDAPISQWGENRGIVSLFGLGGDQGLSVDNRHCCVRCSTERSRLGVGVYPAPALTQNGSYGAVAASLCCRDGEYLALVG
jgi:hypothetical protein